MKLNVPFCEWDQERNFSIIIKINKFDVEWYSCESYEVRHFSNNEHDKYINLINISALTEAAQLYGEGLAYSECSDDPNILFLDI